MAWRVFHSGLDCLNLPFAYLAFLHSLLIWNKNVLISFKVVLISSQELVSGAIIHSVVNGKRMREVWPIL